MLAVRDRNELVGQWRNARLLRLEDTSEEVQWRLLTVTLTEDGVFIAEPGDGCPAAGFTTLADVGMTYYDVIIPTPVERQRDSEEELQGRIARMQRRRMHDNDVGQLSTCGVRAGSWRLCS